MTTKICKPKTLKILHSGDPNSCFQHMTPSEILSQYGPPRRLLSTSHKVEKSRAFGVFALVLYLTPGLFCPAATKACLEACLGHTSGRMGFHTHSLARDRRAALYLTNPSMFIKRLSAELTLLETDALQYGLTPAARLNGCSDVLWERYHPDLFASFPAIQFWDYTKLYGRMLDFLGGTFPTNYHLTFSLDANNIRYANDLLQQGANVAAVFWPTLPDTWFGSPVIDGDRDDNRFLDPSGVIVGLRAKGLARVDTKGFTIRPCPDCGPSAPSLTLTSSSQDSHYHTLHQCKLCGYEVSAKWKVPIPKTPKLNPQSTQQVQLTLVK